MPNKVFQKYVVKKYLRALEGGVQVYLAHQAVLERDVELRVLDGACAEGSEEYQRFDRQFRLLARLDHPGIAPLLDAGRAGNRVFYSTEFRNAVTLQELLGRIGEPMTRQEVGEVATAIASALAYVHEQDLLHRNLSSRTVSYDLDSKRPFISDFSLMKDLRQAPLTQQGRATPLQRLLTPELLTAAPYTAATDLFMLGALLYQLATNVDPLDIKDVADDADVAAVFAFRPPSTLNTFVPRPLEELIMGLLRVDPAQRTPSTARACLEELKLKELLMDAKSLISEERAELLNKLRGSKPLVAPPERPAPGRPVSEDEVSTEVDGPLPAAPTVPSVPAVPSAPAKKLPGAGTVVAEVHFVLQALRDGARADSWGAVGGILLAVVVVGILGFAALSGHLFAPAPIGPPVDDGTPVRTGDATGLGRDVLEMARALGTSPTTERNFIPRLKLLKAFALSLPPERQKQLVPYTRIMEIKMLFYRDPSGACGRLEESFRDCERWLSPEVEKSGR